MWSHAINDGSLGGGETDAISPENVFCRACERASSASDIRHFFTVNSVYAIPYRARSLRSVFGGWSTQRNRDRAQRQACEHHDQPCGFRGPGGL